MTGPPVVILAAGHGRRMGGPKALKVHGGRSFLQRILDRCAESGSPVVLAVDPAFRTDVERLTAAHGAPLRWVEADGTRPMLATLQAALAAPPPVEAAGGGGFWLWPVDAPFLSPQGWARAREAAAGEPGTIWKLRVEGRTGHPIWFPAWSVAPIRDGDWSDGLLGYLEEQAARIRILHLEREVIADFNTPESLSDAPGA